MLAYIMLIESVVCVGMSVMVIESVVCVGMYVM